jgi:hypothetical protein
MNQLVGIFVGRVPMGGAVFDRVTGLVRLGDAVSSQTGFPVG